MEQTLKIVKRLQDADKTLDADGYKSWCYVRLAIMDAIQVLKQFVDDEISVQYTVFCGGREYKTKLKKGDRVKVGCYCGVLILDSIDEIQTSIFNKLYWYTVTESYL